MSVCKWESGRERPGVKRRRHELSEKTERDQIGRKREVEKRERKR